MAQQERRRTAEEERRHQLAKEAEEQRALDEARESKNDSINVLNDTEENLMLETALTKPSLGVSGTDNGLIEQQGHEVGVDVAQQGGHEGEEDQGEIPLSLDSSLETVFGPGATLLAKKLGSYSDKREELKLSDTEINSDNEVKHVKASTPLKEQRKKRVRNNINSGDLGSIQGTEDNSDVSSEGEHSEEATKEVKKPRLLGGKSGDTSKDKNVETLESKNNLAENKSNYSEELAEEIGGVTDNNEGSKEEDNIEKALLDLHEDAPLEDPGPSLVSEDGEERVEDVPLEDPGPSLVSEDGEGRVAGATQ